MIHTCADSHGASIASREGLISRWANAFYTKGPVSRPRTIVADPPWWPRLHANTKGRAAGPYRTGPQRYYRLLTVEQIEAMAPATAKKAHLWLWVINQHVDWGYRVARAWGFEPQQMVTWCKPTLGTGQFQSNTESVLVCRKGGPVGNAFGRTHGTHFTWRRRRHSEKPDEFFRRRGHIWRCLHARNDQGGPPLATSSVTLATKGQNHENTLRRAA